MRITANTDDCRRVLVTIPNWVGDVDLTDLAALLVVYGTTCP